jgi:hypothetical protein
MVMFFVGLGCASLSNSWVGVVLVHSTWLSCLCKTISHWLPYSQVNLDLIAKTMCALIALVWTCELAQTHAGYTTEWLCTPSQPNKLVAGFWKIFCLVAVIACWVCTFECSQVPRDSADTLISALTSGVSILALAMVPIAILEFLLVLDWRIFASASFRVLVGLSLPGTALLHIILWAVPSLGPIETWPWKGFLELLVWATWSLSVSRSGVVTFFPVVLMAWGLRSWCAWFLLVLLVLAYVHPAHLDDCFWRWTH